MVKKDKLHKEIMRHYWNGWHDSSDAKNKTIHKAFDEPIYQSAYNLGWSDFIIGDDVNSLDWQTEEQIFKRIKEL